MTSRSIFFFGMATNRRCIRALGFACLLTGILWQIGWEGTADAEAGEGPATYARDVAPIFRETCESCHRSGMIGPMELTNYEQVRPWAKSIKQQVASGEMPPFHATGPIGRYKNDYRLTPEQIETVARWVDQGARLGDPASLPPPKVWPSEQWSIGKPDLVLTFSEPYRIDPNSREAYVFLPIDHEFEEDTWLEASEIIPGAPAAVHHATVFMYPGDQVIPRMGETLHRGISINRRTLAATGTKYNFTGWSPGNPVRIEPEGTAIRIPKGHKIGIDMHYIPQEDPIYDSTTIGFHFANRRVYKTFQNLTMANKASEFILLPRDAHYEKRKTSVLSTDALVRSFDCHMHLRGKSFEILAHLPDGTVESVFSLPKYDFSWERNYELIDPILLPKGTEVEMVAVWDNSDANPNNPNPARRVRIGYGSSDEMLVAGFRYEIPGEELANPMWLRDGKVVPAPANGEGPLQPSAD